MGKKRHSARNGVFRHLFLLMFAFFIVFPSTETRADSGIRFVKFHRSNEAKFVREYLSTAPDFKDDLREGWMDLARVEVGHFDVNDDGENELFLILPGLVNCGTMGCTTLIFQKRASQWVRIGAFPAFWVNVSDKEIIDGYRTLNSHEFGARWNGTEYRSFMYRPEGG